MNRLSICVTWADAAGVRSGAVAFDLVRLK
jgi:hypothetical protein